MAQANLSVDQASALIGLVYDSALEPSQWQSLTERLGALCPGHVAAVVTFEDTRWVSSHVPTLPDDAQGDLIRDLTDEVHAGTVEQPNDLNDALFSRQPLALGTLYATHRIFSDAEFRSFEGYKSTMAPIGAGHWTGAHFSIAEGRRAAIMLVENDFDLAPKDRDLSANLIALIASHMIRAARFARALGMARDAAKTYSGFIDAIALPMLVLSKDRHFQMANSLGQRMLDAGQLLHLDSAERVSLAYPEAEKMFVKAITAAEEDRGPHAIQVDAEDATIALCVCPYRPALAFASDVDRKMFEGQHLFVVLVGARPVGAISLKLIQDAFGLTQREAEVCRGLLKGAKPSELAVDMDKSEKTIRNQIQSVHMKVGVKSTRDLTDVLSVFRSVGAMYATPGGETSK
ncbi:helix-turn-helix transcriptional regulator [Roseobacter litoralis]|uniref:helix-turn-helix transcriptional regulator n=1 Tax=Roseobacter litoralis TaxID=42443 RepID=UPI00248FD9A9|nr:LuxR C-terminal-related transcriptional regulator [Roseobacter litoralis]